MKHSSKNIYLVGVVERAIAYYEVEADDARTAAENWQDGEFHDRDDEALDSEGPCNVRVRQSDGTWKKRPPSEWAAEPPAAGCQPYSVLLLYPDYLNDTGTETYYAFVEATDPIDAAAVAKGQAAAEDSPDIGDPDDFATLLVIQGHHYGQPLFNK
jgi:hypothetical protein